MFEHREEIINLYKNKNYIECEELCSHSIRKHNGDQEIYDIRNACREELASIGFITKHEKFKASLTEIGETFERAKHYELSYRSMKWGEYYELTEQDLLVIRKHLLEGTERPNFWETPKGITKEMCKNIDRALQLLGEEYKIFIKACGCFQIMLYYQDKE